MCLACQRLDIDMERISMYIEQEVEQSTSSREQKLLVAEFGLLDAQLTTLINMLQDVEVRGCGTRSKGERSHRIMAEPRGQGESDTGLARSSTCCRM